MRPPSNYGDFNQPGPITIDDQNKNNLNQDLDDSDIGIAYDGNNL